MATPLRKRLTRAPSPAELKAGFARRLNGLLDEAEVAPKGQGRQESARAFLKPAVGEISQKGVRKWLEGEALPELEKAIQLAIFFDVNLDWLLTGRGDRSVSMSVIPLHRKLIDCYEKADTANRQIVDLALGL